MHKVILAASLALVVLPMMACSKTASGKIRTLTLEARGVAFTVEVNGVPSELLSCEGTGATASAVPLDKADFKTRSGDNEIALRILQVDPSADPFLLLDLQESAPGEVLSTGGGAARNPPFPVNLGPERLVKDARLSYRFVLP